MTSQEMIEKMKELNIDGGSSLHMRSETLQSRSRVKRIPMLKKGLKKKSKLLIIAELALPFNPETGESDEKFNADNKYRPPFSVSSVAIHLKAMADSNEALKSTLMRKAGVSEWDTSGDVLTDVDREIFWKYRVPRIFTVPVVHINIPCMTSSEYGRDYAIDVKIDPLTGDIVGEWPLALKVNKLFKDKCYEQINSYQKKIDSGEIHHTDKQQKEYKRQVYNEVPVSDVHPANFAQIIELPLTMKYQLSGDVSLEQSKAEDLEDLMILSRLSKKLHEKLKKYQNGELDKYDNYFDFYELDMSCPTDGDDQTNAGKQQIGLNTEYEKPDNCISDLKDSSYVLSIIQEFIDSKPDIEEVVRRSLYIQPYDSSVEDKLAVSLPTVFSLDNEYVTDRVIKANAEVITLAFGSEGMNLVEESDAGVSGKEAGELDEGKASEEAKKYDLSSDEFTDTEEDDAYAPVLEQVDIDELPFN